MEAFKRGCLEQAWIEFPYLLSSLSYLCGYILQEILFFFFFWFTFRLKRISNNNISSQGYRKFSSNILNYPKIIIMVHFYILSVIIIYKIMDNRFPRNVDYPSPTKPSPSRGGAEYKPSKPRLRRVYCWYKIPLRLKFLLLKFW